MSFKNRFTMLGIGKTLEDVEEEQDRYIQEKNWIEVRNDRMELKQTLWRKRHELFSERWVARSNLLRATTAAWAEAFTSGRLLNLVLRALVFIMFCVGVAALLYPFRAGWDYGTQPVTVVKNPPQRYYVDYVANSTSPSYKHWIVKNSSWGLDKDLSGYYMTHEAAFERLLELKPVWPNVYVYETYTACWQVFESMRGKDKRVSDCFPYYKDAEVERLKLDDRIRGATDSPAIDPAPTFPQSPPPETPSLQSPPPVPSLGVSEIGPEVEDPSGALPSSPSPDPDPEALHPGLFPGNEPR